MGKLTIWTLADEGQNVTIADVAKVYGVDPRTVRKWIDAGLLPARRLPTSGRFLIKADDVDWFDAEHLKGQRAS